MNINNFLSFNILLAAALTFSCCSVDQEEETVLSANIVEQNVSVDFNITITPFDVSQSTISRATSLTWNNGDIIYLLFTTVDGRRTKGTASFDGTKWTASYVGELKRDVATKCMAYYFDGERTESASVLSISPTTGVYADSNASYTYPTGGNLSITCQLKPQTSRIRFKGTAGTKFTLSGLSCCNTFGTAEAMLGKTTAAITLTTGTDGYSPYVYGNFASEEQPQLKLTLGETNFIANCQGQDMLATGESGYMTLPSNTSHNGWTMHTALTEKEVTIEGVTFKMMPVEAGTFTMGSGEYGEELHTVTITQDYYIGETEVTQALWKAVTGNSPTANGKSWESDYGVGDNYPAYNISYEDVQTFITKLNQMTGLQFRMPTEAEWEYAARGGNKSRGFIYSGSDILEDVAWHVGNSYDMGKGKPGYGTHEVKNKTPNELGLYDMTGNVAEWCYDWYDTSYYKNSPLTDPTGPSISKTERVERGGSWSYLSNKYKTIVREKKSPSSRYDYLGFRLAL